MPFAPNPNGIPSLSAKVGAERLPYVIGQKSSTPTELHRLLAPIRLDPFNVDLNLRFTTQRSRFFVAATLA